MDIIFYRNSCSSTHVAFGFYEFKNWPKWFEAGDLIDWHDLLGKFDFVLVIFEIDKTATARHVGLVEQDVVGAFVLSAGVMNVVQKSQSDRSFLFMRHSLAACVSCKCTSFVFFYARRGAITCFGLVMKRLPHDQDFSKSQSTRPCVARPSSTRRCSPHQPLAQVGVIVGSTGLWRL